MSPGHNGTVSDWAGSHCTKISQADGWLWLGSTTITPHDRGQLGGKHILTEILKYFSREKYLNIPSLWFRVNTTITEWGYDRVTRSDLTDRLEACQKCPVRAEGIKIDCAAGDW